MNFKTTLIAMLCPLFIMAQHPSKKKMQQIESQKIAFITKELDLSPEEAQEFWPEYNQYTKEMRENKKNSYQEIRFDEDITDEEAERLLKTHFKTEEIKFEIKSEYFNKFSDMLGWKRTMKLLVAEMKFKKELLQRIRDSKQNNR